MISDFGLSKMEGAGNVMSTACGTPGYVGEFYDLPGAAPITLLPARMKSRPERSSTNAQTSREAEASSG